MGMFEDEPRLKAPRRKRRALLDLNVNLTRRLEAENRDLTSGERVEYESRCREIDRIYRVEIEPVVMELARELDARIAARKAPTVEAIRQAIKAFPEEARLVAFHESGHAVLSILEGRGTESVQVDFQKEGAGWKPVSGNHVARRGPYSKVALMAGVAAGLIEFNDSPPTMGEPEPGPLPCWDRSLRGDLARVAEKYRANHQGGSIRVLARADIREARAVLLKHWPMVRAVALKLLERGTLDGDEAERVAIGALPANQRNELRGRLRQAAWDEKRLGRLGMG